jgi:DNA-binding HxlR family transcriptional regulator
MVTEGKNVVFQINGKTFHTTLDVTMAYIGGKWKPNILWNLRKGAKRFGELKTLIPGITDKMLSIQLKEMEMDGLVVRREYAEMPPRVEYSFTNFGQALIPLLEAIAQCGRELTRIGGAVREGRSNG